MTAAKRRRAVVGSFDELLQRPFRDGVNALCWPRALDGDFGEVARAVAPAAAAEDGVVVVDEARLRALSLSAAGRAAADAMRDDLRRLAALGRAPVLNCITAYPRDERGLPVVTDVMSFHADRAPVEVDTWLCTYHGAPSEGVDNDGARRRVDDPAVRARLLQLYGGSDDAGFADFLRDESFDLHYAVVDDAARFSFGVFHLWRIAVEWPGGAVPPCLHRAPDTGPGDPPRLLLLC